MAKTIKNQKALKKVAPEELESFWDEDVSDAWANLKPKQQIFVKSYLINGNNAAEAYRQSYNPLAIDKYAASLGYQVMISKYIKAILGKLAKNAEMDLLTCRTTYLRGINAFKPVFNPEGDSALEVEDHPTRIKAADSLAKLNGFLIDKSNAELTVNGNVTVQNAVLGDLNQYLTQSGKQPIQKTAENVEVQETQKTEFKSHGGGLDVIE
jgi:hypothetical protein